MAKNRFDSLPRANLFEDYRWVDYFELVCLSDLDLSLNKGMLIDRVKLKEQDSIDKGADDSEFYTIDEDEDDFNFEKESSAYIDERYEIRCELYFEYFNNRAAIFDDFYPFEVSINEIKVKQDYLINSKSRLYIYFLCCSSLGYFKDFQHVFTSDFEEISLSAFKNMLPNSATTYLLGKTTSGSVRHYNGNVYSRFEQLATDLNSNLKIEKSEFPETSSGDGGVDIISWYDFKDNRNSIPVYAGQCKCSPKWVDAPSPSSKLKGIINLDHPAFNLFFIPFAYQVGTGNWHQKHQVQDKVVIDRLRICRLLENDSAILSKLRASEYINSFLEERESII